MSINRRDILEQFEPKGLAPDGPKWQQQKSSQMRTAILEATIDCLEELGYSRVTIKLIADAAKVSSGAMTHHYASKHELISAVIDYLFYKRMELFVAKIQSLSEKQRVNENLGIELAWEDHFTREYRACLQLSVAAQTDEELSRIFLPKAQLYDRMLHAESMRIFPEWRDKPQWLQHASDLVEAVLEGLVLNRVIWDDAEREAVLRAFIASVIRKLRDGELRLPSRREAAKFRGPTGLGRK